MNCEDFKNRLLIDPLSGEKAFLQHKDECNACRQAWESAQLFENNLLSALEAEVPDKLHQRIINSHENRRSRRRTIVWSSLAASLLIMIGITWGIRQQNTSQLEQLAYHVRQHVIIESQHLHDSKDLSRQQITRAFASIKARYQGNLDHVTFAETCEIINQPGLHLVMNGQAGAVTLLIMPEQNIPRRVNLTGNHLEGMIYPLDKGSMAVIAQNGEPIEMSAEKMRMAFLWENSF